MFKILSELYDKKTRHGFLKTVQNDQKAQIYMESRNIERNRRWKQS